MSIEHKEYHPHPLEPENRNSKIKFTIHYEKGKKYWISVIPVKIRKHENTNIVFEEFGAYTGFKQTLIECNRKSKKSLDAAIKLMNERREGYLNYFNKGDNESKSN